MTALKGDICQIFLCQLIGVIGKLIHTKVRTFSTLGYHWVKLPIGYPCTIFIFYELYLDLSTKRSHRASYLSALLGDGGDPAFAERMKVVARHAIEKRAQEGLDLSVFGAFFDYYLTYAISAETGVLVRWLTTGTHESVELMARVMTSLMFVRPGDLYGKTIDFDVPAFGLSLLASFMGQD